MRPRFKRPSFPTVISLIALFVALGGTSYAVIKLPAGSVGNRELKRNAVSASKIRDGSIGPRELTPSASARRGPRGPAGPAGASGALPAPAPWQPLPFVGTWANYGGGHAAAAMRKDHLGKVHLRGLVTKLGDGGDVMATLPAGHRPPERLMFVVVQCDAAARVDLFPSGDLVRVSPQGCEKDYLSLDTVSFWAD